MRWPCVCALWQVMRIGEASEQKEIEAQDQEAEKETAVVSSQNGQQHSIKHNEGENRMPLKIKRIVQIEDHVQNIKIKGFVNFYSGCGREHQPMTIMGSVRKKNFSVRTNGNNTLGEIVKMIVEDLK